MTATGLTDALARFAASASDPADRAAIAVVKRGFTDTLATMIAGRDEPVVGIARRFVTARQSQARDASVLLGADRAATSDAALINATAGHALDYDDVALGGHPSTVLVPAVLAEAEALGASGMDAIRAYLVGYEVWAELAAREPDPYHEKGWHPTAVLGTVAAAAAVCNLHRSSMERCRHAIAIAASMASGVIANFGTMTKPLHAGRAAANGIDALHLAAGGLTAAADAIEHRAGYLAALSPRGRADRSGPADGLGERLRILDAGLSIKRYPMCYAAHRAIDATLDLAAAHGVDADSVRSADVTIGVTQAAMLRNHTPATGLEAKFSLEFALASALVARRVGLRELSDEFVRDPRVQRTMPKVRTHTTDTRCPVEPVFALTDRVVLELADGRRLDSGEVRFPRGNAKLPLRDEELEAKFVDCTSGAEELEASRLYALLDGLEGLDNMRRLGEVWIPSTRAGARAGSIAPTLS